MNKKIIAYIQEKGVLSNTPFFIYLTSFILYPYTQT
jgi:hypothetical protein